MLSLEIAPCTRLIRLIDGLIVTITQFPHGRFNIYYKLNKLNPSFCSGIDQKKRFSYS